MPNGEKRMVATATATTTNNILIQTDFIQKSFKHLVHERSFGNFQKIRIQFYCQREKIMFVYFFGKFFQPP